MQFIDIFFETVVDSTPMFFVILGVMAIFNAVMLVATRKTPRQVAQTRHNQPLYWDMKRKEAHTLLTLE